MVTQKNHPCVGTDPGCLLADHPFGEYRRRYGRDGAMVEVTVSGAALDILELTDKIEGATG